MEDYGNAVLCEPGKYSEIIQTGLSVSDIQELLGGFVQAYFPYDDDTVMLYNGNRTGDNDDFCRAVLSRDEEEYLRGMYGPFLIVNKADSGFRGLSLEQCMEFSGMFRYPEVQAEVNGGKAIFRYEIEPEEREGR